MTYRKIIASAILSIGVSMPLAMPLMAAEVASADGPSKASASMATTSSIAGSNLAASVGGNQVVEQSADSVTGLEPGTLALIGFGLLALAATRRNAR